MPEIETNLAELRRRRGLSAIHLAAAVGVSRQTIYAMEAGTYVPNTAVALRLARALDTSVEELFTLAGGGSAPNLRSQQAILLPGSAPLSEGQAVQLCRVEKKLMAAAPSPVPWYLPATDAVIVDKPGRQGKRACRFFKRKAISQTGFWWPGAIRGFPCSPGMSPPPASNWFSPIAIVHRPWPCSKKVAFTSPGRTSETRRAVNPICRKSDGCFQKTRSR